MFRGTFLVLAFAASLAELPRAALNASAQSDNGQSSQLRAGTRQYRYTNRLINSKSPYLLLHAHNPVDWYPWGNEAFERARKENKPVFLSIGYFTCHWCHVMERESYSDPNVAAILNRHFISVKVDREERPDIDRMYMSYVESTTGAAGWPLNVLLTPERKPFFGGTYLDPDQLKSLLQQAADAWNGQPDLIKQTAERAAQLIQIVNQQPPATDDVRAAILDHVFEQFALTYDDKNGGFGEAPKFPRPPVLSFLLRYYVRTGRRDALDMTLDTLGAMERGGIHDQLGGGFHRYSTGATWLVPHFEKTLYDNAQLAQIYCRAYQISRSPLYARIVHETLGYVIREMMDGSTGAFYTAQDADSEGEEGKFFVWSRDEVEK